MTSSYFDVVVLVVEYQAAFNVFDRDQNGSITAKELGRVMRTLNMETSEVELQDMIAEVDADGEINLTLPQN